MWMADKPAPQQELAEGLASFTLLLAPSDGLLFLDAFYSTMAREWTGIDRLRMDKFYYLLNQMLRSAFELLRDSGWNRESVHSVPNGHGWLVLASGRPLGDRVEHSRLRPAWAHGPAPRAPAAAAAGH
jgi:hypothetical protein